MFKRTFWIGTVVAGWLVIVLAGCASGPKSARIEGAAGNWVYLHTPSGAYLPGQLVDGQQGFVHIEPAKEWITRSSAVPVLQRYGRTEARSILAALPGLSDEVRAALSGASGVEVELVGGERREVVIEQLNRLPAAVKIRDEYNQLAEAFDPQSKVKLVVAVLYATKFRVVAAQSASLAAAFKKVGLVVTAQGDAAFEVLAGASPVAVAIEYASPAFRLLPATALPQPSRVVELTRERITFGLGGGGVLHNTGPYRTELKAELIERVMGNRREIVLRYYGEVKNPHTMGALVGGDDLVVAELKRGAYWAVDPVERARAEIVEASTKEPFYAGSARHKDFGNAWIETYEVAAGKPACFTLKPTRVLIYE